MPNLSSILVQREIATMRSVEEAIARQVLHGGDLATNLLELGSIDEARLVEIQAEAAGLAPAPIGRLDAPPPNVLRLLPGELALRHGVFPLGLRDRLLEIATSEPLSSAVEDDLAFALDVTIRQFAAPIVRIRQAIAEHYGIPMDRRFLRLVARLDGRFDPSPSSLPPELRGDVPMKLPRPVSVPAPSFGTGVASVFPAAPGKTLEASQSAVAEVPSIPKQPPVPEIAAEPEPTPAHTSSPRALTTSPRALVGFLRRALTEEREAGGGVVDKTAPLPPKPARVRRKGPFTTAMAEAELAEAQSIDDVLDTAFTFTGQFFEFAALFVIHGDEVTGRDASGSGADRSRMSGIRVLLDAPTMFSRARERRGPVVLRATSSESDARVVELLERTRPQAHNIAVLPIVVKQRAVAFIYGDDGDLDVDLGTLGDALALIGLAGTAVERLALLRKRGGAITTPRIIHAPSPRGDTARRGGAIALARALTLKERSELPPANPESAPLATAPPRSSAPPPASDRKPRPFDVRAVVPSVSPGAASVRIPEVAPRDEASFAGVDLVEDARVVTHAKRVSEAPAEPKPPTPKPPAVATTESPGAFIEDEDSGESLPKAIARFAETPPAVTEVAARHHVTATYGSEGEARVSTTVVAVEAPARPLPPRPDKTPKPPEVVEAKASLNHVGLDSPPSAPLPVPAIAVPRRHADKPIPREEELPASSGAVSLKNVRPMDSARTPVPPIASVIVDVSNEYASLLQRVIEGGAAGREAFNELVKNSEHALSYLMSRFPGPLRVDRHRARGELPAASQCGPLLELIVAIRRPALPFMTTRTTSTDPEVRFWATHLLGELRYPEAANCLIPRLFDDDVAIRRVARRSATAIVAAGSAGTPLVQGLDHMTRNTDQPIPHRVLAIETMGEIRTGAMVPPLIAALSDPSSEVADAARRALLLIARQDFGKDARKWHEWWSTSSTRHRIEWLIDALMHEQPSIRRAAGDELKQLTKEYFGYYDDLPKRERERAQNLYRAWWEREGRTRFE
jgi:hypothetical protein